MTMGRLELLAICEFCQLLLQALHLHSHEMKIKVFRPLRKLQKIDIHLVKSGGLADTGRHSQLSDIVPLVYTFATWKGMFG